MILLQRLIAGVFSAVLFIVLVDLVRRKKLREEYSILWMASAIAMIVLAARSDLINWLARLLHIQHPAYGLIVMALLMGLSLAIHFTIVLSKLTAQNWRLTQEIGLLEARLNQLTEAKSASLSDREGALLGSDDKVGG